MRLFLLTCLTMLAFAANSVLNKVGVSRGAMEPLDFAMVRVWSGAIMLLALVYMRPRPEERDRGSVTGTVALSVYMFGFSLAYASLDAGVGALILFGVVQITMFGAAMWAGEVIPPRRVIGCATALAGLAALVWPVGSTAPDIWGGALMAAAGVGWGIYTLAGKGAARPLALTERNFRYVAIGLLGIAVVSGPPQGLPLGYTSAVASGAITSALGYALWYKVLPQLATTTAATAQLTVPVIALLGGVVFLGEVLTLRFALSSILILGGVAVALRR